MYEKVVVVENSYEKRQNHSFLSIFFLGVECPPIDEQMKAFKTRKTQIDKYRENVDGKKVVVSNI